MKSLIIFLFFIISVPALAQRVVVSGQINVPEGEEPRGISVINATAGQATVSNEKGAFTIRVAKGDTLQFESLQFQDFSVVIDQGVIDNRVLNVFITEAVTELAEVVVSPYDLSGNVKVDVAIIPVNSTDLPTQSAAEINPYEWEFRPDSLESPPNAAMREGMLYNGANLANIFRSIFSDPDVVANLGVEEELDEQVLLLYDDTFFQEHLKIEKERIHEFIYFAQDNGLKSSMLKEENEMQLLQFLVAQSQEFRQTISGD